MNAITTTLAFGMPGWQELLILGIIGVLIFGKRLPSVGRSVGQSIVEFKKGLAGIDQEVEEAAQKQPEHHASIETAETETHATAGGAA